MKSGARGKSPTVRMSNEHREKIKNSLVLNALIAHAEGRYRMTGTQVTAAIALLRKVLPDLRHVELAGTDGESIKHHFSVTFEAASDQSGNANGYQGNEAQNK